MLLAVRAPGGGTARMGHGVVSDPGQLTSLATTVYRLKQKYDAVTVSSQAEGEPLGSLDVESGVTTIQTRWSRKKPEIGQLLDQMATGLFAAAREYGWTDEQARPGASDNPDAANPGGAQQPRGACRGGGPAGTPPPTRTGRTRVGRNTPAGLVVAADPTRPVGARRRPAAAGAAG